MKVTVNEESKEKKEKVFPMLMISNDGSLVVLFSSKDSGIVISDTSDKDEGYAQWSFHVGFNIFHFKDFNGTVTLQND